MLYGLYCTGRCSKHLPPPGGWRPGCEKRKMMDGAWGDMTTMVGWLVEMGWDGIHEGDLEGRGARE